VSGIETVVPVYGNDKLRRRNLRVVLEHLRQGVGTADGDHVAAYPLWIEDGDSPGQARNRGASNVVSPLIVFNDGDSICPWPQILEAARLAMTTDGLVFAYDLYVRLSERGTVDYLAGASLDDCASERTIAQSGSMGCVAISRECFRKVGGFSENFVGWGYEDLHFASRCNMLWPNRRVMGPLYHLWHGERNPDDSPVDSDPAEVAENLHLWSTRHKTKVAPS
jgi:hypothetical protein